MTLLQFILIQLDLVILFGLYKWISGPKGQIQLNRWFLLLAPAVAIALPFLTFPTSEAPTYSVLLPVVTSVQSAAETHPTLIDWAQIAFWTGASIVAALFLRALWQVIRPRKATFLEHYKGYSVYVLEEPKTTTHSVFNRIYLHTAHLEFKEMVLEHEYAHCKHHHTLDLLVMALYKSVFWFNPVVYRWEKEMQLNHEFLADAHVLSGGVPAKTYGATLLALNFAGKGPTLVHAFNRPSSLRKRIIQFNNQNKFTMKHLILIPAVAGLALATMSLTSVPTNSAPTSPLVTPKLQKGGPETQPEFPGGKEKLITYMSEAIKYPESLKNENITAKVFVEFTVLESGKIANVHALKSSGYDVMDDEAIRVVKGMPDWKPGTKEGQKVDTKVTLPIIFTTN